MRVSKINKEKCLRRKHTPNIVSVLIFMEPQCTCRLIASATIKIQGQTSNHCHSNKIRFD